MRKRVAQRIRSSVIKGLHDGAKAYDPYLMLSTPPYLHDFDPLYIFTAYNRAYRSANRKLVQSMTDAEREQADHEYRRRFMTPAERQQDDLLREVRALQSTVSELQAQITTLEQS